MADDEIEIGRTLHHLKTRLDGELSPSLRLGYELLFVDWMTFWDNGLYDQTLAPYRNWYSQYAQRIDHGNGAVEVYAVEAA